MESSQFLAAVLDVHRDALARGLFFQECQDVRLRERTVTIAGRECVSWSSCSYLGLEFHPALLAGVHDAVDRFGTQFSTSRGYLSAPPYRALEATLEELFGAHVFVTPSTTLAHLIALPVLADERDAIVLDHQAHHSVALGVNQARAGGATVEIVRHDHLTELPERIERLSRRFRTVWFATDGVFSMVGDLLPSELVARLLAIAPNVRLYVDDAHGMSWAGRHGRGAFLDRCGLDPRVVVATSFAKGFAAGGGCLLFADRAECDRVRLSGGPNVFSGPMQPPMIGAALASARLHLSDALPPLQATLRERVTRANERLTSGGYAPWVVNDSPIVFLRCGLPRVAFRAAAMLLERGHYVNCSVYPTVPMRRAGIRLSLTAAHSAEQVDAVADALAEAVPAAIAAEGFTPEEVASFFEAGSGAKRARATRGVEVVGAARELPADLWNAAFGTRTHCSTPALAVVERLYGRPDARPEHRWHLRYALVRDGGRLVAAAPITTLLQKDDFLSRAEVSAAIEAIRVEKPYHLTSRVVMLGHNLSEGDHLFLDRSAAWRPALRQLLAEAQAEMERSHADALVVRDLPGADPELDAFMLAEGLVKVPSLDTHVIFLREPDEASWYAGLAKKKRQQLRPVLAEAGDYHVTVHGAFGVPLDPALAERLEGQYRSLAERKFRINIFQLPTGFLAALAESPAWELGVLWLDDAPVGFWAAHRWKADYAPLVCGLDPEWRLRRETYRAMLLQILRRARSLGAERVRLGMDAELEKRRFGAETQPTCVYAQVADHSAGALLRETGAGVAFADTADV